MWAEAQPAATGEALRTRVFPLGESMIAERPDRMAELETHRPWGGWYGHYERSPKALIVPA